MKTLLITKPRLAGRLFRAGYKGEETINPFRPDLKAWEFKLDERAKELINDFYDESRKPMPTSLKNWIVGKQEDD